LIDKCNIENIHIFCEFIYLALFFFVVLQTIFFDVGRYVVKPLQMNITSITEGMCCCYDSDDASLCREYPCFKYSIQATLQHNQVCSFKFYYEQQEGSDRVTLEMVQEWCKNLQPVLSTMIIIAC